MRLLSRRDMPQTSSSKRTLPRILILLCVFSVFMVMSLMFGMRGAWFTQNDVTTGETAAYPELTSHVYAVPPERVYEALRAAAAAVPKWKVVREDSAAREIAVEVRTALFWFTDDLNARVEPEGSGSRVVIRSHSRVGRGDLGENARHIAALQQRMDRALTLRKGFEPPSRQERQGSL